LIAGEKISLNIEIRTSNPNLRRNSWFTKPSDNIKLSFSKENVNYTINRGLKKGKYIIELAPIKSAHASDPNLISISIDGEKYTKF